MLQEENNEEYQKERFLYILLMTVNVSITLVIMLAACLCCKKKLPKNDLLGLEGMVKLKNPDEVVVVTQLNASESHVDLNNSTVSQADSEKRASTAAHRSLPDIPVAEANGDTGSELYETVADKMLMDAQNQNKSPTPSLKKQISVSQHSSISQADDVSSPYSRVKNSPHDYAKVRPTEHPYAQLNAPSTSHLASSAPSSNSIVDGAQSQQHHHHHTSGTQLNVSNNESIHQQRTSHHSDNAEHANDNGQHEAEIPAASAIAGMISASQDLPYMTPPIANQHFSGDSQDSSKGYTSISVREPLANILAQQPQVQSATRSAGHSRDVNDSHYATVSDDSGSPKPEKRQANSPLPPTPKSNVSSSTTQLQALSSSNLTSGRNSVISVIECAGELMEEGVTDVPLDSSPQRRNKSLSPSKDIEGMYAKVMKKNKFSRNSPSSQNSSPILQRKYNTDDSASALGVSPLDKLESNNSYGVNTINDRRLRSNSYGASKDHGYETIPADAMRGNSTQGIIENRKSDGYAHVLQKERQRENVHTSSSVPPINVYSVQLNNSDKHYETIAQPPNAASSNDPGYETLEKPKNLHHHQQQLLQDDCEKKSSDYDPNYEVLKGPTNSAGASDDGYAKVLEKKNVLVDGEDSLDGYSKVRGETETAAGYSTIADVKRTDANHNYASILETKREAIGGGGGNSDDNQLETDSDHYARIAEKNIAAGEQATTIRTPPNLPLSASQKSMVDEELLTPRTTTELSITSPTSITSSSMLNTTSSINSTSTNLTTTSTISSRQTPTSSSQYESLTGSETDPNYESVCYLNTSGQEGEENPYERLHTEISDDITQLSSPEASTHTAGATTTTTTTNSSSSSSSNSSAAAAAAMAEQHSKMLKANGSKVTITNQDNTANDILVNDYFQV
ncbi:serine-rich adhesin for platelets isoform X3 [Musca domestica]|uniref:Serine-rich adhesin for platelets isoform X3 n=1 Tax=Musca domestica TaxID=7370 RepID=A0ABM3USF6_MUSDO|nr:serine-rich adhesin for platelets isoform X3 [Musca domestica]